MDGLVFDRERQRPITILGDLAQGTAVWSPDSWQQVLDLLGYPDTDVVHELRLGYRVPKPILDYAARLLPVAAPDVTRPESFRKGEPPQFHRVGTDEVWDTALGLIGSAGGRTVLIVPDDQVVPLRARSGIAVDDGSGPSSVLPPDGVKGLEFDQAIVVEPAQLASRDRRGFRQLYVALTRSTKRLDIVHAENLPAILDGEMLGDLDSSPGIDDPQVVWEIGTETTDLAVLVPLPDAPRDVSALPPDAEIDEGPGYEVSPDPAATPEPVAAWFDDPVSRFTYRFWDGAQWTGWVAAASGAVAADPNPFGHLAEPAVAPAAFEPVGLPQGSILTADLPEPGPESFT